MTMVTDREIQLLIRFLKENKIFVETSIKMDEAINGFWKNRFFKPDVSKLDKIGMIKRAFNVDFKKDDISAFFNKQYTLNSYDNEKLNKDVNWRWFSTEWQKYYEKKI